MIRHSRLPKRKIQKQRDALFVENILLKMQVAVLEIQCQCIISNQRAPSGLAEGGVIVEQATLKLGELGEFINTGADGYEIKLETPK